jgi:hypothetical protein
MGKFAELDDVTSRFEGEFPSDREDWAELRITDAENALMGLVPSLRKTVDEIQADSVARGDLSRLDRVKSLVCDKVLQLYRNPDGSTTRLRTVDDVTESRSWFRNELGGMITFTDEELTGVRVYKRRARIGVIGVTPWMPQRSCLGTEPWRHF